MQLSGTTLAIMGGEVEAASLSNATGIAIDNARTFDHFNNNYNGCI